MTPAAFALLPQRTADEDVLRGAVLKALQAGEPKPLRGVLDSVEGEIGYFDDIAVRALIWHLIDTHVLRLTDDRRLVLATGP